MMGMYAHTIIIYLLLYLFQEGLRCLLPLPNPLKTYNIYTTVCPG